MEAAIECMAYRRTAFWKKPFLYLLLGLAIFSFTIASAFTFLYVVAIALLASAFFFRKRIDQEFDYTYFEGDLRVDKVYAQNNRKHLKTFEIDKIEILAPAGSERLRSFSYKNAQLLNYSGLSYTDDSDLYVMYYNHEYKVLLTLSKKMVKAMKRAHPFAIYTGEEQYY